MIFKFECPGCKKTFSVTHQDLAAGPAALKCCLCGDTPAPNIQAAYRNIGKTLVDLYGCCDCGPDRNWLPKKIES